MTIPSSFSDKVAPILQKIGSQKEVFGKAIGDEAQKIFNKEQPSVADVSLLKEHVEKRLGSAKKLENPLKFDDMDVSLNEKGVRAIKELIETINELSNILENNIIDPHRRV